MLQTPAQPRKYRPLKARQPEFGFPVSKLGQYASVPPKYAANPNFLHYRLGPGSDLPSACLSNADLRWSNFRGANLSGAKLCGSILWGAILTNTNLSAADISHADFTGVDLVGADLTGAKTEGTCFVGARYSLDTVFPKGFGNPEKKGMVGLSQSMQLS
jgi:hypothetical protein